jgi:uncharacterized membrane protein YidH (DUF202 family)
VKPESDDPGIVDPVDRTRLAWTRTSIAFAAIGAAILKSSPVAGVIVLALAVPIWAAVRGTDGSPDGHARRLPLVTAAVLLVATAALVIAVIGHGPSTLAELLHGR